VSILRELVDRKWDSGFDCDSPKSVYSSRLFERIGVALQKGNAQGILDFRFKVCAPENAEYDAVIRAWSTGSARHCPGQACPCGQARLAFRNKLSYAELYSTIVYP
jgi:hypothetical protein